MDGAELVAWRQARNLTQAQLAELLGVHKITVSKWERGERATPGHIFELALEALDARLARDQSASHRRG